MCDSRLINYIQNLVSRVNMCKFIMKKIIIEFSELFFTFKKTVKLCLRLWFLCQFAFC